MPWLISKRMLDPEQLSAIRLALDPGNCFIKGEAGTGKSIVLGHAALEYQQLHPGARICVITYTNSLVSCLAEALEPHGIETMTIYKFRARRNVPYYDCVFVDEVQDMEKTLAKTVKARSRKLVLFGDFGQRLYEDMKELITEADIFNFFLVKNTATLMIDHRLPKNHRLLVEKIFVGRKFESKVGRLLANAEVTLFKGDSQNDEFDFAAERGKASARPGVPAAIIFEWKKNIFSFLHKVDPLLDKETIDPKTVNSLLLEHGVPFRFLGNGEGELAEGDSRALTFVMTWYSVKGLDFETVIIPDLGGSPCREKPFYVALTRSTRNLVLTYSGRETRSIELAKSCPFVHFVGRDSLGKTIGMTTKGPIQASLFDNQDEGDLF